MADTILQVWAVCLIGGLLVMVVFFIVTGLRRGKEVRAAALVIPSGVVG